MATKFVLVADRQVTEHGTFVKPWSGTFQDDDPIRDEFLELCEKGSMEVDPLRKPRRTRTRSSKEPGPIEKEEKEE